VGVSKDYSGESLNAPSRKDGKRLGRLPVPGDRYLPQEKYGLDPCPASGAA